MRINSTFYYLLFIVFISVSSCDNYQKVLKSNDLEYKYQRALEYFDNGKYFKAATILEDLVSLYKGRPEVQDIYYLFAQSNYELGQYLISAYHFKNFHDTYPRSEKAEAAYFMHAESYNMLSPKPSLDQTYSTKAIDAYQLFVNSYPQSAKVAECNVQIDNIRDKLEIKNFETSMLYYNLGDYKSAASAFQSFNRDYPFSRYNEESVFFMLKSKFLIAENSIESKKEERYRDTISYYEQIINGFANSKYLKEAEQIFEASLTFLNKS